VFDLKGLLHAKRLVGGRRCYLSIRLWYWCRPVRMVPISPDSGLARACAYRPRAVAAIATEHFPEHAGAFEFVMLGDSITAAGNWSELFPTVRIANRGIDGSTSSDTLSRIDEIIERRPKIVFLMIGINDLIRNVEASEITANVQSIIGTLAEHGIPTIVQSTLLTDNSHKVLNEKVIELNQALQRLCAQNNVKFIDLNSILSDGDALNHRFTWDGIHLWGDAYVRWAHEIRPIIDSTQPR
jgi:lysophospholipase L1-like esterase